VAPTRIRERAEDSRHTVYFQISKFHFNSRRQSRPFGQVKLLRRRVGSTTYIANTDRSNEQIGRIIRLVTRDVGAHRGSELFCVDFWCFCFERLAYKGEEKLDSGIHELSVRAAEGLLPIPIRMAVGHLEEGFQSR
jgi:hypothetical protein